MTKYQGVVSWSSFEILRGAGVRETSFPSQGPGRWIAKDCHLLQVVNLQRLATQREPTRAGVAHRNKNLPPTSLEIGKERDENDIQHYQNEALKTCMYTSRYKQKKIVCDIDKKSDWRYQLSITKERTKIIDRLQKHVSNICVTCNAHTFCFVERRQGREFFSMGGIVYRRRKESAFLIPDLIWI